MLMKENMYFNDFIEFYAKKKLIRVMFGRMMRDEREMYKYYIYSKRIFSVKICDMIWEYLNAIDDEELVQCVSNIEEEYKKRK